LAKAGIDAAEKKVMEGLQRLLLEELHHQIKNLIATRHGHRVPELKKRSQR
jgi:two-component sensor histidine kinase